MMMSLRRSKQAGFVSDWGSTEYAAALYKKRDGDVRAVFEDLAESPRKALKYPPANAAEFGKKYAQGFYTYADEK
jgi:hypothetical protein